MEFINVHTMVIFTVVVLIIYKYWKAAENLKQLPTFREYTGQFPSPNGKGASCCHCGSTYLRNFGVTGVNDQDRIVRCGHCDAALYRTTR